MPRNRRHGGCITCRRRCRSCDKQRPACSQCANDGLVCGSYGEMEAQFAWVHATQETMKFNKGYPRPPSSSGSLPPSSPRTVPRRTEPEPEAEPEAEVDTQSHTQAEDVRHLLHESLVRSTTEQLFLNMFLSTNALPAGRLRSPEVPAAELSMSATGWTAAVEEFYHAEPSIRHAAEAMSTGVVGAIGQSSQLWTRSMQAYNLAVGELIKALKGRKRVPSEGVVAACRMLHMYELLFGQANRWRGHLEGQLATFLARGPEAFVSGPAHELYVDARILMIILTLGKRCKSPLSTPEWRSIPWRESPRSAMDALLDIAEDMMEMLGEHDHLRACRYAQDMEHFRASVLTGCRQMHARLQVWLESAGVDVHIYDHLAAGLPLPVPRTPAELAVLHTSSIYWVVQLVLCATAAEAEARPEAELKPTTMPKREPTADAGLYAAKIAHAVPLFFEADAGAAALFPMAMAAQCFAATDGLDSAESRMLLDVLGRPSMGAAVGRFLSQLQGGCVESVPESPKSERIWWYVVLG